MFDADTRALVSILEYCEIKYKLEKPLNFSIMRNGHSSHNTQDADEDWKNEITISHGKNRLSGLDGILKYIRFNY